MDYSGTEKTRIDNTWPVAREGIPFIIVGTVITLVLLVTGLLGPGIFMGVLSLFTLYFFRDPERNHETVENALLAPADGKVLDIVYLKNRDNLLGEPAVKVSIFMSVFNVHVNRVPMDGKITEIVYNSGKFFSANLDKASEQNENNRISLETDDGKKIVFVQIAGLIARRIVCWVKKHDHVKAGQRCGLIRFGSRLDIYLPNDSRVTVRPRQKVKAGETLLGYLS